MRDRDMLGVPIDYYRRPLREPDGEERPPLSRRARRVIIAVTGTLVLALVALFVVFGLPLLANWNGFALPGERGLPYRIRINGQEYDNPSTCARRSWCGDKPNYVPMEEITRRGHTPLVRVGSVSTLFGPEHAIFIPTNPPDILGQSGWIVYVQDGDRYLAFFRGGGP